MTGSVVHAAVRVSVLSDLFSTVTSELVTRSRAWRDVARVRDRAAVHHDRRPIGVVQNQAGP